MRAVFDTEKKHGMHGIESDHFIRYPGACYLPAPWFAAGEVTAYTEVVPICSGRLGIAVADLTWQRGAA